MAASSAVPAGLSSEPRPWGAAVPLLAPRRWAVWHARAAMPRRGEQGPSVCPCARPSARYKGAAGRGKRKSAAPPTGARKTGGAGAKAAPAGLPSALAATITTADPRMQEVGTEDKPKQKPFPKLPPDPVRRCAAVQEHAGRTPSEPAATLRKIGPRPPPRMCQTTPSPPSRCRYRATSSQRPARGWKGACSAVWGAALSVQASRLWTGGSRCPRRPSS